MVVGLAQQIYDAAIKLVDRRCNVDACDDLHAYLEGVQPEPLAEALRQGRDSALRTYRLGEPTQAALRHWSTACVEKLLVLSTLWSEAERAHRAGDDEAESLLDDYFARLESWSEESFDLFHELVAPTLRASPSARPPGAALGVA